MGVKAPAELPGCPAVQGQPAQLVKQVPQAISGLRAWPDWTVLMELLVLLERREQQEVRGAPELRVVQVQPALPDLTVLMVLPG